MKLMFPQFDGTRRARVGSGDHCVLLLIEDNDYNRLDGWIVLTDTEAHDLGVRLQQQARSSRRPNR